MEILKGGSCQAALKHNKNKVGRTSEKPNIMKMQRAHKSFESSYSQTTLTPIDIKIKSQSCEHSGHLMEAQCLLEDAIEKILKELSHEYRKCKRELYRKQLSKHTTHLNELRNQFGFHNRVPQLLESISIGEGTQNNSYQRLFGSFLSTEVRELHLYEPKLSTPDHFKNLLNFLELVAKKCPYLKFIRLVTRPSISQELAQLNMLRKVRFIMGGKHVDLNYRFDAELDENIILLSTGIAIKSERGIHYFQPVEELSLGTCDFDFRKCLQTSVDIWYFQDPSLRVV